MGGRGGAGGRARGAGDERAGCRAADRGDDVLRRNLEQGRERRVASVRAVSGGRRGRRGAGERTRRGNSCGEGRLCHAGANEPDRLDASRVPDAGKDGDGGWPARSGGTRAGSARAGETRDVPRHGAGRQGDRCADQCRAAGRAGGGRRAADRAGALRGGDQGERHRRGEQSGGVRGGARAGGGRRWGEGGGGEAAVGSAADTQREMRWRNIRHSRGR